MTKGVTRVRTMLEDEFKHGVDEVQDLTARTIEMSSEILKRAGDAFQLEIAIENEWLSVRRQSRQRRAEYLAQIQFD